MMRRMDDTTTVWELRDSPSFQQQQQQQQVYSETTAAATATAVHVVG